MSKRFVITESEKREILKKYKMVETRINVGGPDLNDLAKKIVLSKKYDEIVDEMSPEDYGDEFEFGDNFISNLLDEYVEDDFYDDLYDVVKMEYGDIILSLYQG